MLDEILTLQLPSDEPIAQYLQLGDGILYAEDKNGMGFYILYGKPAWAIGNEAKKIAYRPDPDETDGEVYMFSQAMGGIVLCECGSEDYTFCDCSRSECMEMLRRSLKLYPSYFEDPDRELPEEALSEA